MGSHTNPLDVVNGSGFLAGVGGNAGGSGGGAGSLSAFIEIEGLKRLLASCFLARA